jgi:hypothetical protein
MKSFKVFGLAIVAAIAAMAVIGASSASAALLCLDSACTEHKNLVEFLSSTEEGTFKSGFVTVKCHVLVHIETTEQNDNLWSAVKVKFTLTSCSGCTTVTVTVANAEAMATAGGGGVIKGNGEAVFKGCPFGVECKYKGEGTETVVDGSATNALGLVIEQSLPKSGGGALCSSSGIWNASFHGVSAADKMTFMG